MIEEKESQSLSKSYNEFKLVIRSHLKSIAGFFIALTIVWGIFGLFCISDDVYLIGIVLFIFAIPVSSILGLLILISLSILLAKSIKFKSKKKNRSKNET